MRYFLFALLMSLSISVAASSKLSQAEYKLLTQAAELIEAEQYVAAQQQLLQGKEVIKSDYAQALFAQSLGQVALLREDYKAALTHLEKAYRLNTLSEPQQTGLMRTLAQLNCMQEQWQKCVTLLEGWMQAMPDTVSAADYFLLGQAHGQMEHWRQVVQAMASALSMRTDAPESWYQLKVVAHIQLEQWRQAIAVQRELVSRYDQKPQNWRQLVSLHLRVEDNPAALADQRIAYERGLLREGGDHRLLAQLLLRADAPFFAGEVLKSGIDSDALKENKRSLKLLVQCWIRAKEFEKAASALTRLNQLAPSEKSLTQLAHLQVQLQHWERAEKTLLKVLKRAKKSAAKMHLLLGIVRTNLKDYELAQQNFALAAVDKRLKSQVEGWVRYLQQVDPYFQSPSSS